ncbi:hypothetical protein VTL71DRAFT_15164 [Oculimacula yallundae]|uniref:Uncharacterized protein n=1 Tax=Oculimacula yallundae TaxID=86028 RepID=A0ABR4CH34_9HELO
MSDSPRSSPDPVEGEPHQQSSLPLEVNSGESVSVNTSSESGVEVLVPETDSQVKEDMNVIPGKISGRPSALIDLTENSDDELEFLAQKAIKREPSMSLKKKNVITISEDVPIDLTQESDNTQIDFPTPSGILDGKAIKKEPSTPLNKKVISIAKDGSIDLTQDSDDDELIIPTPSEILDRKTFKKELSMTPEKEKFTLNFEDDSKDVESKAEADDKVKFPSLLEILDYKAIKKEPAMPPKKKDVLKFGDGSTDIKDDADDYGGTESEDNYSDVDDSLPMQIPQKRKQHGPMARTAREYHRRRNAKLSIAQRRGYTWKKERLAKLQEKLEKYIASKKPRHLPKANAKDFNPDQFFNNDPWSRDDSSGSVDDLDDGARLQAKTRKGVWEEFEAHYSHLDLKRTKTDNNDLVKSAASFGLGKVKRAKNGWLLEGMKCSLRNHQLRCVSWMTKRECSNEEPHGGIVADVMGLGKTVQCLALVVANPQEPLLTVKATLVIVPASLKSQWWSELAIHTPDLIDTSMVFESKRVDNAISKMSKCSIVITTYGELIKSLPQPDAAKIRMWEKKQLDIREMTLKWTKKHIEDKGGLLHCIPWYRIIIDECTPVMNRYEEFHSMLRFLRDPLTANIPPHTFRNLYCDIHDVCTPLLIKTEESKLTPMEIGSRQGLGIILSDLIIRRTLKDKIMGFPIIKLEPTYREIREVKRYLPERLLYRYMKDHLQELLIQDFEDGDERKNLGSLLPQMTRLRQLIANPDLIARQIMIVLGSEGMKELKRTLKSEVFATKAQPQRRILIARLNRWILAEKVDAYKTLTAEETCAKCKQPDESLLVLRKCGCKFCGGCIANNPTSDIEDDGEECGRCPSCRKGYTVGSDINAYVPAENPGKAATRAKKEVRKGKDIRGFRPTLTPDQKWPLEWLKDFDEDKDVEILPTAKLRGTILQIEAWLREAPSDKIIVFTQFRFFAILVGIMLERKKVKFIYYTGDMTSKDRDNAVQHMRTDPIAQVMIAGLKCGGTGLNFQFANRGIITDIWWNTCIDEQALGRFQRLGQEKSVYFIRIVVSKTIDSTIAKLQDTKKKAIAHVIQDNDLDEIELAHILGYVDGEPDEEPDTSDDESGDYHEDDGF